MPTPFAPSPLLPSLFIILRCRWLMTAQCYPSPKDRCFNRIQAETKGIKCEEMGYTGCCNFTFLQYKDVLRWGLAARQLDCYQQGIMPGLGNSSEQTGTWAAWHGFLYWKLCMGNEAGFWSRAEGVSIAPPLLNAAWSKINKSRKNHTLNLILSLSHVMLLLQSRNCIFSSSYSLLRQLFCWGISNHSHTVGV